jgi:hypothetical protein
MDLNRNNIIDVAKVQSIEKQGVLLIKTYTIDQPIVEEININSLFDEQRDCITRLNDYQEAMDKLQVRLDELQVIIEDYQNAPEIKSEPIDPDIKIN